MRSLTVCYARRFISSTSGETVLYSGKEDREHHERVDIILQKKKKDERGM
jgi:hypothetical protein